MTVGLTPVPRGSDPHSARYLTHRHTHTHTLAIMTNNGNSASVVTGSDMLKKGLAEMFKVCGRWNEFGHGLRLNGFSLGASCCRVV